MGQPMDWQQKCDIYCIVLDAKVSSSMITQRNAHMLNGAANKLMWTVS